MKRRLEHNPEELKAFNSKYSCIKDDESAESSDEELETLPTVIVEEDDSEGTLSDGHLENSKNSKKEGGIQV